MVITLSANNDKMIIITRNNLLLLLVTLSRLSHLQIHHRHHLQVDPVVLRFLLLPRCRLTLPHPQRRHRSTNEREYVAFAAIVFTVGVKIVCFNLVKWFFVAGN